MSAARALSAYQAGQVRERVLELIAQRGIKFSQFTAAVYGRDDNGRSRNTGYVYNIFKGKSTLTKKTADRWGKALGVSGESLLKPKSSAPVLGDSKLGRPATKPEPRLIFVVNHDGTADLRLNLVRVQLEAAIKILKLLEIPGILPGEKLALTHEKN